MTALNGADAANYMLAASGNSVGTRTIAPKPITLTANYAISYAPGSTGAITPEGISVANAPSTADKTTYDGLTNVVLSGGSLGAGDVVGTAIAALIARASLRPLQAPQG